ncbi:MAG: DUF58 domain-containing protein [Chloroflexota bacterium]
MKRTARFYSFLVAAFLFWTFANQTQIGWLYVVSAVLGGALFAAWLLNRGVLKKLNAQRELSVRTGEALHEGDDLAITLTIENSGQLPAAHLALIETNPLADPNSDAHEAGMFVPLLPNKAQFTYHVDVYRRGVHHFPDMQTRSRAPFGFYERQSTLAVPTDVLVYPEVLKLTRLALLDEQPAAELTNPNAGMGSEVIGVRPYRPGDSPRHIHWRSVARRGNLVSKEFAQETRPGVTVVLDRYVPHPVPESKHQPFEIAIKCAVSIAEYAMRNGYPVHIVADQDDMASPQGALVWDALMQYTARVTPTDSNTLADVLGHYPMQQYVAIAVSTPDDSLLEAIVALKHRGYNVLVVIPDPASYPIDSDLSADGFVGALERQNIVTRLIKHGDDWASVISNEDDYE